MSAISLIASNAFCKSFVSCAAEMQKRTLGNVTGVAGAPTTTTAKPLLNANRLKSPILYGWYNITGIIGDGWSPSTSNPNSFNPFRKNNEFSLNFSNFFLPISVPSSPAMTRNDSKTCAHTAAGIAVASVYPIENLLIALITFLSPATYPPAAPNDFVYVPIMILISFGSTPSSSVTPRPVFPIAPIECASSKYTCALYNLHTSTISFKLHNSPSME